MVLKEVGEGPGYVSCGCYVPDGEELAYLAGVLDEVSEKACGEIGEDGGPELGEDGVYALVVLLPSNGF